MERSGAHSSPPVLFECTHAHQQVLEAQGLHLSLNAGDLESIESDFCRETLLKCVNACTQVLEAKALHVSLTVDDVECLEARCCDASTLVRKSALDAITAQALKSTDAAQTVCICARVRESVHVCERKRDHMLFPSCTGY